MQNPDFRKVDSTNVPAPTGTPASAYAWFVVCALSFSYLLANLDRYLIGVAMPAMKADLGLSDTQLGLLSGPAFALFYCLFSIPLGRLADVVNRCRLIAGGLIVWSAATAAVAFSDSFNTFFAARALVGMGEAALVPAGAALIAAYFARGQVGRATGVMLAGSSLGKAAAFIGGGALLAVLTTTGGMQLFHHFAPWQALFIIAAIPGLLMGALFSVLRDPGRASTAPQRPLLGEALKHLGRHRTVYSLHFIAASCAFLAAAVFATWSPSFYVRKYGLNPSTAAMLVGVATVCTGPLGHWFGGVILDSLRRRGIDNAPAWLIGLALLMTVPATALLTLSSSLPLSLAAYGLAQMAAQMAGVPALLGVQMLTPPEHRGLMVATQSTVIAIITMSLGPAITGAVNDQLFQGQQLGYSILLVVTAFAFLGVLCALTALRSFSRLVAQTGN